ncbi:MULTISPECIES: hypothetical protein [unclassified Acinetobacter]|uniref:hypothetical protein n=1 Tax=unclassified Acinetobacter TaxID=196816 RepID=UPI0015D2B69D|nr:MULTISPECIES: hypothetical protein [unclassified Acinetobacter]UUS56562.1 hypothetical protein MST16_10735 [Acinetobacter sp. YH16040_T]
MNKEELYNLSKERLYIIYQDLKSSNVDKDILHSIQFFDVIPSESIWENYISKNENKVIHFNNDLKISEKYRNYTDIEKALDDLKWFTDNNKLFFLFYNKKNTILFDFNFFDLIIKKSNFLDNEDYLLYCFDTKKIITGGWQGFAIWERPIN